MTRYNYTFTGKKISETAEFSEASASELKILMALIDLAGEATDEELMQKCDTSKSRVSAAIALWEESGVIKLLQEGDYTMEAKRNNKKNEPISTIYWLVATAIYLAYSFITNDWGKSWIIWPVAGVLYAAVMVVCNMIKPKQK